MTETAASHFNWQSEALCGPDFTLQVEELVIEKIYPAVYPELDMAGWPLFERNIFSTADHAKLPNGDYPRDTKVAKAICDACIVKTDCQQYALANKEDHDIWGGLTSFDRRALMRKSIR